MAAPSRISLVSPAVDFIDNRLSDHHPAFVDPPTYFDHNLDRYVMATTGTESALQIAGPITREPGALIASETLTVGSPASQVYSFSQILTEFRSAFPVEPKGRVDKKCSIRSATNWGEVLEIVELSGEAYYSSSGVKGKVRRAARIVGDRADTLKRVTGVVPDVDYSRPIVGALTFILDVRMCPPAVSHCCVANLSTGFQTNKQSSHCCQRWPRRIENEIWNDRRLPQNLLY